MITSLFISSTIAILLISKNKSNGVTTAVNSSPFFSPLTDNQLFRGTDLHGSGFYGASRRNENGTSRSHNGIDIIVSKYQTIYAPISGYIRRYSMPYSNDSRWLGLLIEGNGKHQNYEMKIWYFQPYSGILGTNVYAGQAIGKAQDLREKYSDITPHCHVEVRYKGALIDPTSLFFKPV